MSSSYRPAMAQPAAGAAGSGERAAGYGYPAAPAGTNAQRYAPQDDRYNTYTSNGQYSTQSTAVDPSYGSSPAYGNTSASGLVDKDLVVKRTFALTDKAKKRLYWIIPICILGIILVILFEIYKSDFERWVRPASDWLTARDSWSWLIPVGILVVLSIPPLFGHEVVLLVVGLAYPIGVGIGIACAGAVLGEALCFLLFKYAFTGWVDRKRERIVKWEAIARLAKETGFKGVMVIRYSIIPPHLANPLFATTGMSFFVYMASVILSLPKNIVFVALGNPSAEHKSGAKVGKVIAVGVLVLITLWASWWLRKRLNLLKAEIRAERGEKLAGHNVHDSSIVGTAPYGSAAATGPGKTGSRFGNGNAVGGNGKGNGNGNANGSAYPYPSQEGQGFPVPNHYQSQPQPQDQVEPESQTQQWGTYPRPMPQQYAPPAGAPPSNTHGGYTEPHYYTTERPGQGYPTYSSNNV